MIILRMMLTAAAVVALLWAAPCEAQNSQGGTRIIALPSGTPSGSSSIFSGATPCTGCASGGVLFNNGGVVTADSGFTKVAGATGAITVGGALLFSPDNSADIGDAGGTVRPRSGYFGTNVTTGGSFIAGGNVNAGGTGAIFWNGRSIMNSPANGQWRVQTAGASSTLMDFGVNLANTLSINGALELNTAAPTVAAGQIGYGGTVAAVANCNVTSPTPTGCVVINVAGTTRYMPYY